MTRLEIITALYTNPGDYSHLGCPTPTLPGRVLRELPETLELGPGRNVVDLVKCIETSLERLDSPARCLVSLAEEALEEMIVKLNATPAAG